MFFNHVLSQSKVLLFRILPVICVRPHYPPRLDSLKMLCVTHEIQPWPDYCDVHDEITLLRDLHSSRMSFEPPLTCFAQRNKKDTKDFTKIHLLFAEMLYEKSTFFMQKLNHSRNNTLGQRISCEMLPWCKKSTLTSNNSTVNYMTSSARAFMDNNVLF